MSGRIRAGGPSRSFVVVAYDIANDRRRSQAAAILVGFGGRIQGSVYELWLDERRLERLWAALGKVVRDGDLVRCYVLCNACRRRTRSFGLNAPEDDVVYIV